MKSFNKSFSLFICLSLILLSMGYSKTKTPSYPWSKNNIELSVEGAISRLTFNEAQDHILIRNATRKAGYEAITKIILTLPLDSTRQINNLSKTLVGFPQQLDQWIVTNADFIQFQFSSITTGTAKVTVNTNELAQFISRFDKPVVVKKEVKKEEKKEAKAENKAKPEEKKKAEPPKKLKKALDVWTSMTIVRDTTIPANVLTSQAESGVTKLAKDEIQRQLDETEIVQGITYKQWMNSHASNNGPVQATVARTLKIAKPEWNKEMTVVKVNIKLNLDEIRKAISKAEKEATDEQKPTLTQDTTVKPAGTNTK